MIIIFIEQNVNSFLSNPIISTILGTCGAGFIAWIANYFYKILKNNRNWKKQQLSELNKVIESDEQLELIKSQRYIPTMGQKESPHNEHEVHLDKNRFLLIDKFLKVFYLSEKSINKKRYIILGGSGMGKSLFVAALVYKYIHVAL